MVSLGLLWKAKQCTLKKKIQLMKRCKLLKSLFVLTILCKFPKKLAVSVKGLHFRPGN